MVLKIGTNHNVLSSSLINEELNMVLVVMSNIFEKCWHGIVLNPEDDSTTSGFGTFAH